MNAYVTLLSSDDFLPGVLVLNRNLKELNSLFPLHVLVTNTVSESTIEYLKKEQIQYEIISPIYYPPMTLEKTPNKRLQNIPSKLHVFDLKQFDKVVYLDTDCILFKTIDEIFDYPNGSMYYEGEQGLCCLFVCEPKLHCAKYYIDILQNNAIWESEVIETLLFPCKADEHYRISENYFASITTNLEKFFPLQHNLFGLHFCCDFKPWQYNNIKDYLYDYKQRFNEYSINREQLVAFYFTHYLEPLKKDYPELFI